jgi:hypothetical protein
MMICCCSTSAYILENGKPYNDLHSIRMIYIYYWCRPQDVVVFIVGGTTYEESRSVALQNASISGIRFILGGSAVLNSKR